MSTVATSLLPAEIRPVKYQVSLSPNLTAFTFIGEETIEIEVSQPTSQIVLNAAELEIQEAYLLRDGQRTPAQAIATDGEAETVTLTRAAPSLAGMNQHTRPRSRFLWSSPSTSRPSPTCLSSAKRLRGRGQSWCTLPNPLS